MPVPWAYAVEIHIGMVPQKSPPRPSAGGGAVPDIWCRCAAGQFVSDAQLKGNAKAGSAALRRYASLRQLAHLGSKVAEDRPRFLAAPEPDCRCAGTIGSSASACQR